MTSLYKILVQALPCKILLLSLSAIAFLQHADSVSAQVWTPNETQASSEAELIDYEFSQLRGQFTWNDTLGNLWIGNVDRATGLFYPANGRGILVDPNSMTFQDAQKTKNGPEWVRTSMGDVIVHTKYDGRHTDGNSRLGYAHENSDGSWTSTFLGPSLVRKAPYGSAVVSDPASRISYVDNQGVHYWRELLNASTERPISNFPASNYPVRHVSCEQPGYAGTRAVVYPVTVAGVDQVFYRDFDTNTAVQLTNDSGNKYEVWMWCAPEFNNELIFFTLVDQNKIRVYRNVLAANGTRQWTVVSSWTAPQGNEIFSPEPFTWNGHSYIFMAQSVQPNKFRSEIWIGSDLISPTGILSAKRITPNTLLRTRTDPEVFITSAGPKIYYNRLVPTWSETRDKYKSCRDPSCSDGVWFADPGLN